MDLKGDRLKFRLEPTGRRPRLCLAVAFFVGLVLRTVWALLEPLSAAVLSALFLYTIAPIFLGTTVVLEADGVLVKSPLQPAKKRAWSRFRAFVSDRNGLFLSPYREFRKLEGRRGLFLPLAPDDRRAVEEYCLGRGLTRRDL